MNLRLSESLDGSASLMRRMFASPGRTLLPVALSLAVITILVFAMVTQGPPTAQAEVEPEITAIDVQDTLIRLGLDAESLTAAGVGSQSVPTIISTVSSRLESMDPPLASLDADVASARGDVSRLSRTVRSGKGSGETVSSLTTVQTALATAEAARASALQTVFEAATATLSEDQIEALEMLTANARWNVATEFKVVSRTEEEWVALRSALAYERVAAENPEDAEENPTATALLSTARAATPVVNAKASLIASLDSITSACDTALANLDGGE